MTNDLVHKMTPEEEKVEFERITNPEFMDKELRQVANETIAELQREVDLLNLRVEQLEREIYNLEWTRFGSWHGNVSLAGGSGIRTERLIQYCQSESQSEQHDIPSSCCNLQQYDVVRYDGYAHGT
jgi:hypothetical protein